VESVKVQTREKRVQKLTVSLQNLLKLSDAGLIEAYVLFVKQMRASSGIMLLTENPTATNSNNTG
jgi:hypothetical protein